MAVSGQPILIVPPFLFVTGLGFTTASQAQYLRAGGSTLVASQSGNDSDTTELDWTSRAASAVVSQATSSTDGGATASLLFTAGFGVLRSSLGAEVAGLGPLQAQAGGTFASFNNFVGAAFFDRIMLGGAGPEVQLKVDAFSVGLASSWRIDQAPIVHEGSGEHVTAATFVVNGTSGQRFDLLVESSSLVSAFTPEGQLGDRRSIADASHTGLIAITP